MNRVVLSIAFLVLSVCMLVAQERTMGLLQNEEGAYNGYTLFGNNETTYLIDNCGYVVNTWQSAYKTGHGMYFFEDGTLLRQGNIPGAFDAGGRGGIFELFEWDGEIIWSATIATEDLHTHHDMALLPNGHFLCIAWERRSAEEAQGKGRIYGGEVWSERILEIEILPDNQYAIAWQWSLWDHLIQDRDPALPNYGVVAEHPELLDINYIGNYGNTEGNWIHANAIDYNEELDQIVFSSRLLSEVYVIDHSTTTAEAKGHTGGQYGRGGDILYRYGNPQVYQQGDASDQRLDGQHNIRWITDAAPHAGNFMVFNNEYIRDQQSEVLIFQSPADEDGSYQFSTEAGYGADTVIKSIVIDDLHSDILSSAQPLPNGNILITEGRPGNFLEINPEDEQVWHYVNPVNRNGGPGAQGGTPRFNMTFKAERYPMDFIGFLNKDMTPGDPIELSSTSYECTLYDDMTTSANEISEQVEWGIYYDQSSRWMKVQSLKGGHGQLSIYNLLGQPIYHHEITSADQLIKIPLDIQGVNAIVLRSGSKVRTWMMYF